MLASGIRHDAYSSSFLSNILTFVLALPLSQAALFSPMPSRNLDLDPLGRIALTGNFDAISLYSYIQTNNGGPAGFNGSLAQSLILPLPDGNLLPISSADADILALCPLKADDGAVTKIIVGGNFTSLGGIESAGIATFDPTTSKISAIPGLSGQVRTLHCDQESGSVYVGGDFRGSNSSNAMVWTAKSGLSNLPFGGFNGPVLSIIPSQNGRILFGGAFDGLGNTTTPSEKDQQIINLETARISAGSGTTRGGFDNPRNVICPDGQGGKDKTWLLTDNAPGYWRASMNFGFQPTKLRIRNTHLDGRGTKTFRFTALPDNGILNMTYVDPKSGNTVACEARCPLSDDSSEAYRDFRFVNVVGMDGFQLDISEWYGQGGGFDGVELFQDDIYAYAVDDFNEPSCANLRFGSSATKTGNWEVKPSQQSSADYLSSNVDPDDQDERVSITFFPDIQQSGNYSITIFTPGCVGDGTCSSRGIVNVTTQLTASSKYPLQTFLSQTNNFDKYDQIYLGHVDASSSNFRPFVRVTPRTNQNVIDFVASRVRFQLISSTGGLNGLYEFDPSQKEVSNNFSTSAINRAGTELETGAVVSALAWIDDDLLIAGKFTNSSTKNIVSLSSGKALSLPNDGLDSAVVSILLLDNLLYVGGNFSNTARGDNDQLRGVAAYSPSDKSWKPLGAGVNGPVTSLVRFPVNISAEQTEVTIAVSGDFTSINEVDDQPAISANGFAVWVPSKNKWLQELEIEQMAYVGQLTASVRTDNETLLAGNLATGGIASHGAASLIDDDGLNLRSLPVNIQLGETEASSRKRFVETDNVQGVLTGLFDKESGRNLTILAGHFSATTTNGSTANNLLFINGSDNDSVTGADPGIEESSLFLTLGIHQSLLFAGGKIKGNVQNSDVNGLAVYDLSKSQWSTSQPAAFDDDDAVVRAIAPRPNSNHIYVGGRFRSAGSLPCPAICNFQIDGSQWSRPGTDFQGNISDIMWATENRLIVAGNLTVSGNSTMLASYDAAQQTWTTITGNSSSSIDGEVRALGLARKDGSRFWIAGKSTSGSPYLVLYDGTQFHPVPSLFGDSTTIEGLQVLHVTEDHGESPFLDKNQVLFVTGKLQLPNFGIVSGALFNGSSLDPLILSSLADGQPGSITGLFTENKIDLAGGRNPRPRGIVILISFCIALGLVFLLVLLGIILNRIRRHRQGYVAAPQGTDRKPDLTRVPPEYLLESLRHRKPGVPNI
ncbi:hypothetical protein FQN57_006864 [Myotisia sp. PD_48]|nr:hypothetical protein FQN57_006864 [Myotisia sp. PD_48]